MELHLHGDILVPDLAGWRRERMRELPDAAAFELAPDWTCDVRSSSTAAPDRAEKTRIYARERVAKVWLVDPIVRTPEALRVDGASWTLLGACRKDVKLRVEPFDAFEVERVAPWAK